MIHIVAWMYELCAGRVRLWMTSIDCRHPRPCHRRRRCSRWRCFSPFLHVTPVWSFFTDNPRFLFDVICTMIDSHSFSSLSDRFVLPNVVNRVNDDRLIIAVRSFVSGSDLRKRNFGLSIVLGSIVLARVRYVERESRMDVGCDRRIMSFTDRFILRSVIWRRVNGTKSDWTLTYVTEGELIFLWKVSSCLLE